MTSFQAKPLEKTRSGRGLIDGSPGMRGPGGLSRRVIRGAAWTMGSKIVVQALGLAKLIVLAKFLTPADFGVMNAAMIVLGLLDMFTEPGFGVALVQRRGNVVDFLGTAWGAAIVRGLCLSVLIFCVAPLVAEFFGEGQIILVMRVLALMPLLSSLANPTTVLWAREFRFERIFTLAWVSQAAAAACGIAGALALRNIWALVIATLAEGIVRVVASHVLGSKAPRPAFDIERVRELARFGRWVLLGRILTFVLSEGDKAFVGRVFGSANLGLYAMARRVGNLGATEFTQVFQRVMLPAYAAIQDSKERLARAYESVMYATMCVAFPVCAGTVVLASDLTRHVLGSAWLPMVPVLQLLAIDGFSRSLAATTGPFYQGTGRPERASHFQALHLALSGALLFPAGLYYGLEGVASVMVLGAVIAHGWALLKICEITGVPLGRLVRLALGPAAAAVGMTGVAVTMSQIWAGTLSGFAGTCIASAVVYLAILFCLDRQRLEQVRRQVVSSLRSSISQELKVPARA